jgi:AP-3 complex subunit beta
MYGIHVLVLTRHQLSPSDDEHMLLGSLGVITSQDMRRVCFLPDWLEEGTESSLRDTEDDNPLHAPPAYLSAQRLRGTSRLSSPVVLTPVEGTSPSNASVMRSGIGSKVPWTDLDKFYEDGDDTEEESGEDGHSNKQYSDDEDAELADEDSDGDVSDNGGDYNE